MRLWHYELIDVLPRQQLLAQWRELNTIFTGKCKNHILVNYALRETPKDDLYNYTKAVIKEFCNRGYHISAQSLQNADKYFNTMNDFEIFTSNPYGQWILRPFWTIHDNQYLTICYWNLREKYIRGQKGFTKEIWDKIDERYKSIIGGTK